MLPKLKREIELLFHSPWLAVIAGIVNMNITVNAITLMNTEIVEVYSAIATQWADMTADKQNFYVYHMQMSGL